MLIEFMDLKLLLNYCYTNSERKFETASSLFRSKKYSDCLFFCHLTLEFLLKGKYVEIKKEMFPIIHDLEKIALKIDLPLDKAQKETLAMINTFNIAGRYDDYKLSFYKQADKEFAKKYFEHTKKLRIWIKKFIPKDK